ncbi:CHC2-type zinc finger protein [Arcicella aurantiaca]|uniref:CHC2-type zinc finger protein n=1 Tax=Arcicella aurantiaca TaxID=591202 RepID=A0A316EGT4_9BACT|nr:toprim domain-containing protein [Arcicella aurantiaca]PWK28964.1 CHC2-type zinc finger protein [Arcicella aurantiaca]
MKTHEQINQLKQISIIDYLSGKGISPVSRNGSNFLYHSPLRQDSTPSFSVSPTLNVFNDFGNDADKGSIIDLVMKLEKIGFVDACSLLERMDDKRERDGSQTLSLSCRPISQEDPEGYTIKSVANLQHPALMRYVKNRGINLNTAFNYLQEIHYTNSKGQFFGVGYKTDNGGYVLRSEIMQKPINLGKSGIKTFTFPNSNTISVFEGMFDFLSAIEYYKRPPRCTAIILNSVTNLSKAIPQLTEATTIYSYMDNDEAGRKATQKMRDAGLNVQDCSSMYSDKDFKDFNEFLASTI